MTTVLVMVIMILDTINQKTRKMAMMGMLCLIVGMLIMALVLEGRVTNKLYLASRSPSGKMYVNKSESKIDTYQHYQAKIIPDSIKKNLRIQQNMMRNEALSMDKIRRYVRAEMICISVYFGILIIFSLYGVIFQGVSTCIHIHTCIYIYIYIYMYVYICIYIYSYT